MAKQSIATLLPRFSATRMLRDYSRKLYIPAARQGKRYAATQHALAAELAEWKSRVRAAWPKVTIVRSDSGAASMPFGEKLRLEVVVHLAGLRPQDICVEFLLERPARDGAALNEQCARFEPCGISDGEAQRYMVELAPEFCGRLYYFIRAYPYHESLAHRFELGLMLWI